MSEPPNVQDSSSAGSGAIRKDVLVGGSLTYRLAILTHGDSAPLQRTLRSFEENVTPEPLDVVYVYDGSVMPFARKVGYGSSTRTVSVGKPLGFCGATKRLWEEAAEPGVQFVFWLEQDFEFVRPVDLRALATVLTVNPQLAQVALMRDAVNETEKNAGGLFESRPGQYRQQMEVLADDGVADDRDPSATLIPWLEHEIYFTTNPSLMLRSFMEANPWPDYPEFCEGKFGLDLRAKGFRFAAMGSGEPWVRHVGVRDGFGY